MITLETAERLAELHMRRQRLHEIEEAGWRLVQSKPELRSRANLYRKACSVLHDEIRRLEELALAELGA